VIKGKGEIHCRFTQNSVVVTYFAWVFEMTPEGLKKETEVDRSASIVSATGHRLNYVIIGFLIVAVALLLVERDPLYRPAFGNAIQMFNNFGRQEKAEALLKRIEAFDPDNPDLLLARATNLVYSGRYG
jgi:hypothetical protein